MTATASPTLRWSSVKTCPRKAVLEATVEPDRDWYESERRIMFRGKRVGQDYAVMLATAAEGLIWVDSGESYWVPPTMQATSREYAAFVCELRVPWLAGVGHVDIYSTETETAIEVLSSRYITQAHSKLLQVVGYGSRIPECKAVCLVIVDPGDLSEEKVVVVKDSEQWNTLLEEVHNRTAEIAEWQDCGTMPERVCSKPSEARSHFCRHAATCFEGWEAPEVDSIDSEDAQQLAIRLAHVKAKRRELSAADKLVEAEQKEIQGELETLVPAGAFQIGGYLVKRSDRTRQSFKLTLAQEDSRIPDDLLDEFTSVSHFSVWDVERNGPAVVIGDDWEDVPF